MVWSEQWKRTFIEWSSTVCSLVVNVLQQESTDKERVLVLFCYIPRRHGKTLLLELLCQQFPSQLMRCYVRGRRRAIASNEHIGNHDTSFKAVQNLYRNCEGVQIPILCMDDYWFLLKKNKLSPQQWLQELQKQERLPSLLILTSSVLPSLSDAQPPTLLRATEDAQLMLVSWDRQSFSAPLFSLSPT